MRNIGYMRLIMYAKRTKISLSAIRTALIRIGEKKVEISTLFDNRILNRLICEKLIKVPSIQQQSGNVSNIEFYDGYYSIVIPNHAPIDYIEENSLECLNLLKKYFEKKLPQFCIYYTDKGVIGISHIIYLNKYISYLTNAVKNPKTQKIPTDTITRLLLSYPKEQLEKEIKYRNIYIDYLSVLHNYKRIYKCWENINGKNEDSFIFSALLNNRTIAIFYENISFARATEIFISTIDNYEACIKSVFSFFSASKKEKRDAIRCHKISESDFCAISYYSIIHYDLNYWQSAIEKIIMGNESISSHAEFKFNIGLKVSKNRGAASIEAKNYMTKNLHDQIIRQLYDVLNAEYPNCVGTEILITNNNRVDTVVRLKDGSYAFYEIKTYDNPSKCIQEGIGQLMQYKFLVNSIINVKKLVIVGTNEPTDDIMNYIKMYNSPMLPIEYMYINISDHSI